MSSKRVRPPTILDVAHQARVSKSTVSNVIRGAAGVSGPTQAKVLAAIRRMQYRPNALARQLVQRRTSIFGIVVGDLANPFYAEMAKYVADHAAARGYQVMFCNTRVDEAAELAAIESLLQHRVAGIVFLSYARSPSHARRVIGDRVPVVFLTCRSPWGDVVTGNDHAGGFLATQHLIRLGHRQIGYLCNPIAEDLADQERRAGFVKAMELNHLIPTVLRWQCAPDLVSRSNVAMPLASVLHGPRRVTAIFAANDLSAVEVLDRADRLGIGVPRELSVVGFDDVMVAGLRRINLTTVAQPKDMLARTAVEVLAGRIEGTVRGKAVRKIVEYELVVRGSTASLAEEEVAENCARGAAAG